MCVRVLRCAAFGMGLAGLALAAPLTAAPSGPALQVGRLTLHRCRTPGAWCAAFERPLDPGGALPGKLSIYFEYYPHRGAAPAVGTLVATEGGPGYGDTDWRE